MIRAYEYLFYKLYSFESIWKWFDPVPEFSALLIMVCLEWMNIYWILGVSERLVHARLIPALSNWQVIVAMCLIALPQYFLLVHNRKYKRIAKEFSSEGKWQKYIGSGLVLLYVLLSVGLIIA